MRKSALILVASVVIAGCFFGGNNETSTVGPTNTNNNKDTLPKAQLKLITPGLYTGDYTWIDSGKDSLQSEFILNQDGSYRLFWISRNEAVYDQRGKWSQRDSNFYFNTATETWISNGVFDNFAKIEDDTNAVINVTDSTFMRREWTPLRQRPYWITYRVKTFPKLKEGKYEEVQSYIDSSDSVPKKHVTTYSVTLSGSDFGLNINQDSVDQYQVSAKWYQIGSFLATDQNQQRQIDDSTKTFPAVWDTISGSILKRLQAVSDTSFSMWTPGSIFSDGYWDVYTRASK